VEVAQEAEGTVLAGDIQDTEVVEAEAAAMVDTVAGQGT